MNITEAPKLTGIVKAQGTCDCCGRKLGKVFQLSNGNEYGRACAAKITGYKVTDQAVRIAETLRRNTIAAAELSAESASFATAWATQDTAAWETLIAYRNGDFNITEALEVFGRLAA
jgi:hypothetical protein